MPEMIPHSFERAAFLGGYGERGKAAKIDVAAKKIDKVMRIRPIDEPAKRKITEGARDVVVGLGNGVETVGELQEILNDPNKTETQKRNADHSLEILSKGAFVAMQYGGNQELVDLLGRGSVVEIEARLPEPLKGLGERILGNIIDDENILSELRTLDKRRERAAMAGQAGDKVLAEAIDKSLGRLIEMDNVNEDQLKMVLAYLGTERLELMETSEQVQTRTAGRGERTTRRERGDEFDDMSAEELLTELLRRDEDGEEVRLSGSESENNAVAAARRFQRMRSRFEREDALEGETSFMSIREALDEIEASDKESGDIGLNTDKLRYLFGVTVGISKGTLRVTDLPNGVQLKDVSREITSRLILNDMALMASNTKDIEGIVKLMVGMHRGDSTHTMDRDMIGFFLNKGSNGLPVDLAWDLRQEAYFNYEGVLRTIATSPDYNYLVGVAGPMRDSASFTDTGVVMHKSEEYGIDRDYGTNLRCDLEVGRVAAVEEYMVRRIMSERHVSEADARKAVELARKLSVATFQDSAANIAFVDGDDYAELILFKWLRYQDGVEVTPGRASEAKNKPVGSIDTIKYIESLTSSWLGTVARKTSDRGMWKPLRAADIDAEAIGGKSDSAYHFASIVFKKVQPVKELFMKDLGPKEMMSMYEMQKAFERLNKTFAEATKAGWVVLNPKYIDSETLRLIASGDRDKRGLTELQRKFRVVFMKNVLERGSLSPLALGWNEETLEELRVQLVTGNHFITSSGKPDGNFIDLDEWNKAVKFSGIVTRIRSAEDRKSRRGIVGGLLGSKR